MDTDFKCILYSTIIGGGKYWRKVDLKGLVGKYLANDVLNKTICPYIINNYCSYDYDDFYYD